MSEFSAGMFVSTLIFCGILVAVWILRTISISEDYEHIDTRIVVTQKYDNNVEKTNIISNTFEILKLNGCIVNSVEEIWHSKNFVKIVGSKESSKNK